MRILIAEDDLTSRAMLKAMLGKFGFDCVLAENGTQALELLQAPDAPNLAVLDWMMPGLTGPEVCRKLRAADSLKPLYIILLTARSERQDIVEGLEAGADDYISKPYNHLELQARINVGRRFLDLQEALVKKEKLQGVIEMAGAICHELNQPLQAVNGYSEMLLLGLPEGDPNAAALRNIRENVKRIGILTRKIMGIASYRTKDYIPGESKIVDIDKASGGKDGKG